MLTLTAAVILTIPAATGSGSSTWSWDSTAGATTSFAYAALITDEYPPSRLDAGGTGAPGHLSPLPAGPARAAVGPRRQPLVTNRRRPASGPLPISGKPFAEPGK